MKTMLTERRTLMGKLQSIESIEDSVRDLYVQMKVGREGVTERGQGQ